MEGDAVIGIIVIAGALAALTLLVVWSRQIIHRIAARRFDSARAIEKDLRRDG